MPADDAAPLAKLVLAADHAGFELKERIKAELRRQGREIDDCGTDSAAPANWAEFGARAAAKVSADPRHTVGILVCGSGIGMSIVANKFPGVRAALCRTEDDARLARRHNDANVLTLGARVVDAPLALRIVAAFLATGFEGGRHQVRLDYLRAHVEGGMMPKK
jgi:ribose 5-phosphate isomerase B